MSKAGVGDDFKDELMPLTRAGSHHKRAMLGDIGWVKAKYDARYPFRAWGYAPELMGSARWAKHASKFGYCSAELNEVWARSD